VFFEGGGELSSVTGRQSLISTFWNQFSVSPIFGHFEAELVSGIGYGWYLHSLPLSFLTHTGIIGFGLIVAILLILLHSRLQRLQIYPWERRQALLMLLILGLATFTTFMTWPVFWFMLGVMCRKPEITR
jgi:O-antigen ligase